MIKKICILTFSIFLSANLHAKVIYNEFNKPNFDYAEIPLSDLVLQASRGDSKAKYLLALHRVYGNQSDKVKGIKSLEKLAASGVLDANQSLFKISSWVKVDSLNKEKAIAYLKEGANRGYAVSQFELAILYKRGELIDKNINQYHYWIEKAAMQGHEESMALIASDYYMGRAVPQDDVQGFKWLIRAYDTMGRDFIRWRMLAEAYEMGRGTPVNLAKAYMCFDLMGTAGVEEKARIEPRMTAAQRAEGLRLSQEWQQKNHVYTMQSLGLKRQKDGSYQ